MMRSLLTVGAMAFVLVLGVGVHDDAWAGRQIAAAKEQDRANNYNANNYNNCILQNLRGVQSDKVAALIAQSCAAKFSDTAPAASRVPSMRGNTALSRFDGQWDWSVNFDGHGPCYPASTTALRIVGGKMKSIVSMSNLGRHLVEGSVDKTGAAEFWGSSPNNIINFQGTFTKGKGAGEIQARNDVLDCFGTWEATKTTP